MVTPFCRKAARLLCDTELEFENHVVALAGNTCFNGSYNFRNFPGEGFIHFDTLSTVVRLVFFLGKFASFRRVLNKNSTEDPSARF